MLILNLKLKMLLNLKVLKLNLKNLAVLNLKVVLSLNLKKGVRGVKDQLDCFKNVTHGSIRMLLLCLLQTPIPFLMKLPCHRMILLRLTLRYVSLLLKLQYHDLILMLNLLP